MCFFSLFPGLIINKKERARGRPNKNTSCVFPPAPPRSLLPPPTPPSPQFPSLIRLRASIMDVYYALGPRAHKKKRRRGGVVVEPKTTAPPPPPMAPSLDPFPSPLACSSLAPLPAAPKRQKKQDQGRGGRKRYSPLPHSTTRACRIRPFCLPPVSSLHAGGWDGPCPNMDRRSGQRPPIPPTPDPFLRIASHPTSSFFARLRRLRLSGLQFGTFED